MLSSRIKGHSAKLIEHMFGVVSNVSHYKILNRLYERIHTNMTCIYECLTSK